MRSMWVFLILFFISAGHMAHANQTIVLIRHGEKPENGSGQLTCKGLNRALALPDVLIKQFGHPDALFASAPKQNKLGSSLRAVQTISPTGIKLSLPIHLNYHAKEVEKLRKALLSKEYENSVIFIAWEHDNLVNVAKDIMKSENGDPAVIPKWPGDDFDSIYVLRINREENMKNIHFEHKQEGLNHVSALCPN